MNSFPRPGEQLARHLRDISSASTSARRLAISTDARVRELQSQVDRLESRLKMLQDRLDRLTGEES